MDTETELTLAAYILTTEYPEADVESTLACYWDLLMGENLVNTTFTDKNQMIRMLFCSAEELDVPSPSLFLEDEESAELENIEFTATTDHIKKNE